MTIFYGARDLYDITGAIAEAKRRPSWLRRHRRALLEYAGALVFILVVMALAGLIDGGTIP